MKLDLGLVREILDDVEAQPAGQLIQRVAVQCDNVHTIAEHVRLMINADLLDGDATVDRERGSHYLIEGLTWDGHDFLKATRNEAVWRKILSKASAIGAGLTLGIAKELGHQYLKELFGLK